MKRSEKSILVTRPYLSPLEKFKKGQEEVWSNQWLTDNWPMVKKYQTKI